MQYFLVDARDGKYILFTYWHVNRIYRGNSVTCVKVRLLEYPESFTGKYSFRRYGTMVKQEQEIYIERDSQRHEPMIYTAFMKKMETYIECSLGNIHVYEFTNPNTIFPSVFYKVFTRTNKRNTWFIERSEPSQPSQRSEPSQPSQRSQPNPLKDLVDRLIREKSTCPITLEEFRYGHITVTGCRHVFETESFQRLPSASCPLCRAAIRREDLVCF
jgi:hypothetical protein